MLGTLDNIRSGIQTAQSGGILTSKVIYDVRSDPEILVFVAEVQVRDPFRLERKLNYRIRHQSCIAHGVNKRCIDI